MGTQNRKAVIALAVAAAAVAGAIGGYLYRRHTHPTFEERVEDAREDLQKAFEKATR